MNMWKDCNGYFTFQNHNGGGFVEPSDDGTWHWVVDKPDDGIAWTDEVFEQVEFEGWWGFQDTMENAMSKVEESLT